MSSSVLSLAIGWAWDFYEVGNSPSIQHPGNCVIFDWTVHFKCEIFDYLICSRQNIVSVFVDVPSRPQNLATLWSLLGEALVYGNMGKGTVLRRVVLHRHIGPRMETSLGRFGLDHTSCKMLQELTHDTKKTKIRPCMTHCMTVQIRCFHSFSGSWTSTVCCLTSCHSWLKFCWPVCAPTSCLCFRGILPSRSSIPLLVFQSFSCPFQLFTSLCQFWPTLGEWWQHVATCFVWQTHLPLSLPTSIKVLKTIVRYCSYSRVWPLVGRIKAVSFGVWSAMLASAFFCVLQPPWFSFSSRSLHVSACGSSFYNPNLSVWVCGCLKWCNQKQLWRGAFVLQAHTTGTDCWLNISRQTLPCSIWAYLCTSRCGCPGDPTFIASQWQVISFVSFVCLVWATWIHLKVSAPYWGYYTKGPGKGLDQKARSHASDISGMWDCFELFQTVSVCFKLVTSLFFYSTFLAWIYSRLLAQDQAHTHTHPY